MKNKKTIIAIAILLFVFIAFATTMRGAWFINDDLGVIINGYVSSFKDLTKVFSEDMRNYATTYNYNLPVPNIISGFLRPMQQLFFSAVYKLFGTTYNAFALLQAFFHALNAMLIFIFFVFWMPIGFATFGALLFAFFPNMGWLTWICTLQHSLALFFLLLALISYVQKGRILFYLSGFFFLLSLLSRESYIFLAPWALLGMSLMSNQKTIPAKLKEGFLETWIFLVASLIYFAMRVHAFGFASLARTGKNVILRFPFLAKFCNLTTEQNLMPSACTHPIISITTNTTSQASFTSYISAKLSNLSNIFFRWTDVLFNTSSNSLPQKLATVLLVIFLITFLILAYRKHKKLALFFMAGIPVFVWPCILIYPAVRYMHQAYPFFIFIIIFGAYSFYKNEKKNYVKTTVLSIMFLILNIAIIKGFNSNIHYRKPNSTLNKPNNPYVNFFKDNLVAPGSNLIFISTLDESDLEQMLQATSNDFTLKVAHIVISKLASKGQHWFNEDYRTVGVPYKTKPITNGYRFISGDKYHCGWIFHAYQPVRWSEKERAYVRAAEHFDENVWYDFSMGKFFIHEMVNNRYVTDVSFVFDKKWITPHTQFVAWDTMEERYRIIEPPGSL